MSKTLTELSRSTWTTENPDMGAINAGSLQRIAAATEKMAERHTELIRQRDSFEKAAHYWREKSDIKDRRIASLKGQITKLRKALAAQPAQQGAGE
ncbi:hypothetical protein HGQ98_00500 [Achromobacter ruhlandii]|uniref:Uncharacterized protein n=1 Tax=Achromobacter ruhlandii TaxID=72557 RepID=A0A848N4U4_9BURK|nr:hypothetical protein [Achromobacter ruhlandii]NMU88369.1 hypothetical protein [Achromobacter ruhlandii]